MKRTIAGRRCLVILLSMFFTALISLCFQMGSAKESAAANSAVRISQIRQILDNNNQEISRLKESLREDYFIRAKAAAYIAENNPKIVGDQAALKKVATLLRVDEFHLFDTEGTLYAGSTEKYIGFTFNSGEQMQFFLPMLEDTSLQLCQEVVPNTAENKLMQYAAVWREDGKGIVQIGMEPTRLLSAMKKTELSHIFSLVTTDRDSILFAASDETEEIQGATNQNLVGKSLEELGIALPRIAKSGGEAECYFSMDGINYYCMIGRAGERLVGVAIPYHSIYADVPYNMLLMVLSLLVLAVAVLLLIMGMLDRYIIQGLHRINRDMDKIAAGDLDYRLEQKSLPEFAELSQSINHMVGSLLETTKKLSVIFQNVNIPIAVYEHNEDMKRVLATNKIGPILGIDEEEMQHLLADREAFRGRMMALWEFSQQLGEDIYLLGKAEPRYVRLRSYQEEGRTLGILVDVTEEMQEKQKIKQERDIDLLTGLASRRAFFDEMDMLFSQPQTLGTTALLMMDVDNLKQVNDNYGHDCGDQLLGAVARLLQACPFPRALPARLSGDELVMFLYGGEDEAALQTAIDALYVAMRQTVLPLPDGTHVPVRFSCGYAFFHAEQADYRKMLHLADETMYRAKKQGKGHYLRSNSAAQAGK